MKTYRSKEMKEAYNEGGYRERYAMDYGNRRIVYIKDSYSKEAVRIGMSERKAKLDELKEKGYQGSKGKIVEVSQKPKAVVADDDIPF